MQQAIEGITQLISANRMLFGVVSGASLILLFATLILIPVVIVRLPPDYMISERRRVLYRYSSHIGFNIFLIACKNILGACLIALGILMLITPGQGLLTILAGVAVGNLPGKYRLERWLVTRRPVWRTVQYLRRRADVPPLEWPL